MAEHQFHVNDEKVKKQRLQQTEDMSPDVSQQADNNDVTGIQRIVGNQGIQRLLNQQESNKPATFIQAKMAVGPADDAYEREADQVANQVMTAPDVTQRQEEDDMQAKRDYLQRDVPGEEEEEPIGETAGPAEVGEAEEDEMQAKRDYLQRQDQDEEDDDVQAKRDYLQRNAAEDDEFPGAAPASAPSAPAPAIAPSASGGGAGGGGVSGAAPATAPSGPSGPASTIEDDDLQAKRSDIQRSAKGEAGFDVGGQLEDAIKSQKGGGQAMPSSEQSFFESRMGADFSKVRVHNDSSSDQINRSISARAFTTGSDVFFKKNEYQPGTSEGRKLMAHELTHVIQQGAAPTKAQRKDDSE